MALFNYLNEMNNLPYNYEREVSTRYRFFSTGRRRVEKIVVFTPLVLKDIFNPGFGDVLRDGSIDDTANTNNGDIIKVLSTVIHIIKDFIDTYPGAKIVCKGSTKDRTMLYQRILKNISSTFYSRPQ